MTHSIKKAFAVVMLFGMLVGFSGCSVFDFLAAENLLKPPKLIGEKAELQSAFENTVGTDVKLFTPIAGEYRGAYIIFDADNDGNEEAIVFYSINSNSSVHMHLLSQVDGKWYSVSDYIGSGTEVYKVDFFNIDNSGNLEISVIWSLDDSKREKTLSVYRILSLAPEAEDAFASLATIQIVDYVHCDVDGDNADELLYFYFDSAGSAVSVCARLIDYDSQNNNLVPISEVKLPSVFASVNQISVDKENGNFRFYVDCVDVGDTYFSEIIIYDAENAALYIPRTEGKNISELSSRMHSIFCEDFNGDGYLDIPVTLYSEESYSVTDTDGTEVSLMFVEWYTYLDGGFLSLGKYFINQYDGYCLKLDALYSNFYVVYDYVNKVTQVRLKNSSEENNIVFSVSCVEIHDETVSILPDGFLGDKNDVEYKIVISAKGETLSFTDAFIKSLIFEL